ncbi:MAG: putative LPS assembly protein LptD [Thermaurantimonas sp.]|uniref:putative LPS assembly protein LptD n=1 Tax=Thermaurantimonas sp. TaxID=2681568 RepID=UPI003918B5B8
MNFHKHKSANLNQDFQNSFLIQNTFARFNHELYPKLVAINLQISKNIHNFSTLLCVLFLLIVVNFAHGQSSDSLVVPASLGGSKRVIKTSKTLLDVVKYTADDTISISTNGNYALLYNNARVEYENISLKAGKIIIYLKTNELVAMGIHDSTGRVVQKPVFTEDGKSYNTDTIRYNFESKRAKIKKVITQEGEGFLHGEEVKMMEDQVLYIRRASFTTCSHEHPHFRIVTQKTKVIPGKQIVTGPAFLEMLDIPTPVIVPFGFFPTIQRQKSGFILPGYTNNAERGYGLTNLGFYWAASRYWDMQINADIYTMGGFQLRTANRYARRYKFSGNVNMTFNRLIIGKPIYSEFGKYINQSDFQITWSHTQDPKARPDLNFTANLNFVTTNFYRTSTFQQNNVLNNNIGSSINLVKTFPGKPISLNIGVNHRQNLQTGQVDLNLPELALNITRVLPFKKKNATGLPRWYEEIGFNYSMNFRNSVSFILDSLGANPLDQLLRRSVNGISHRIPFSGNYRILKHITMVPSFSFNSRWYFQSYSYVYSDSLRRAVITDTLRGFNMLNDFSTSVQFSTKLYGIFNYKYGPLKALRHVMTPRLGLSYTPDFASPGWRGFSGNPYQLVQVDTSGKLGFQNRFQGAVFGTPGLGMQGLVTFGLDNILDAKFKSKRDSTGETKVMLIEGFSIDGNYNMAARDYKWSIINVTARTSLFKGKLNLNYTTSFDPYTLDSIGNRIPVLEFDKTGRLLRQQATTLNLGTSISSSTFDRWFGKSAESNKISTLSSSVATDDFNPAGVTAGDINYYSPVTYVDYMAKWSLSVNYALAYTPSARGNQSSTVQSLMFSGNIELTQNWNINFNSGYDLVRKQIGFTNINITRNLHCWNLSFSWVPVGFQKSYFITINAKAGMLRDLKFDRRRGVGDFPAVL